MFIDLKKIHAAASASFCVRSSIVSALLCCGMLAALPSSAIGQDRRDDNRGQQNSQRQEARQDARQEQPRQLDPRSYEARAEEQRRAMQDNNRNAEMSRRVGRMTADERRDLRRQINEAGAEVYALPPRR
jgi:hypothetical protein